MKHIITDDVNLNAKANINVTLPTDDIKELIDKATDAAITIVAAVTVGHIVKSFFTP